MNIKKGRLTIVFNAPAVLSFVLICVLVQVLNMTTFGKSNELVFSVYRAPLTDPLTYLRCVCHVFGHADWNHLMNNMMYILLLGPMLEEKYGSRNIILVMLATAVATGIMNMIFFPGVMLLGASGVVFAFILLSSVTVTGDHEIPVSFILVAVVYIGKQIYDGIFTADSISQAAHIVGGVVGTVMGFTMNHIKPGKHRR